MFITYAFKMKTHSCLFFGDMVRQQSTESVVNSFCVFITAVVL